jgi:hypothetical protein
MEGAEGTEVLYSLPGARRTPREGSARKETSAGATGRTDAHAHEEVPVFSGLDDMIEETGTCAL